MMFTMILLYKRPCLFVILKRHYQFALKLFICSLSLDHWLTLTLLPGLKEAKLLLPISFFGANSSKYE